MSASLKLKIKVKGPDAEKLLKKVGITKLKAKNGDIKIKKPKAE